MDILERIIENLTSDEVRRFKILSNRFKADEEKKMLILFDAIRAGKFKAVETEVITQFYGSAEGKERNSYYRLRNKLLSNLEKSLLFYHFNYKNSLESLSNIQLSILFRERGLFRESFYNLRKAEKVAIEHDQFELVDVIYSEMIKLATHLEVDIDEVLSKRRSNQKKIDIMRANSEVLGMITQQLMRRNYSRSKGSDTVIDTLDQIRSQLEEHRDIFHSPSGKEIIMRTVVSILIQKSAWQELEEYVREGFSEFESEKLFNQENHPTRLLMRIWRINALLKLLRLDDALEEINLLYKDLKRYNRQNFNEFAFYYYTTRTFALKLSRDLDRAADNLKEALQLEELLHNEVNETYLLISQADLFFCQELYSQASEVIRRIFDHPGFKKLDEEMKLYVKLFGVVCNLEANALPEAEQLHQKIRRKFKGLLKEEFFQRSRRFLDILQRMIKSDQNGKYSSPTEISRKFVEQYGHSEFGDNQIILYEIYLESKQPGAPSYHDLLCKEAKKRLKPMQETTA